VEHLGGFHYFDDTPHAYTEAKQTNVPTENDRQTDRITDFNGLFSLGPYLTLLALSFKFFPSNKGGGV